MELGSSLLWLPCAQGGRQGLGLAQSWYPAEKQRILYVKTKMLSSHLDKPPTSCDIHVLSVTSKSELWLEEGLWKAVLLETQQKKSERNNLLVERKHGIGPVCTQ